MRDYILIYTTIEQCDQFSVKKVPLNGVLTVIFFQTLQASLTNLAVSSNPEFSFEKSYEA